MQALSHGSHFAWAKALCLAVATLWAAPSDLRAETLPAPKGTVILTVRGNIAQTNGKDAAALDLATLESVGVTIALSTCLEVEGE